MGKAKVSALKIVPKYSHQVVETLETLLDQAKRGEITELMATTKWKDGDYTHCWTGCDNLMELVGVLERQKLTALRRMDPDA